MISGYVNCLCRDCFDITVADDMDKGAFCRDCEIASCQDYQGVEGLPQECQRTDWLEEDECDPDPSEPSEEDWVTEDHKTFRQYGRVILTLTGAETEHEMWAAILSTMSADNFYPNVWFISDHGNAHLMRDPRVLDPVSGVLK